MRHRFPAAFVFALLFSILDGAPSQASEAPLPAMLAGLTAFHGQLTYRARAADDPAAVVTGSLETGSQGWTLDERSACCQLHESSSGSWLKNGSQTLVFDDPFDIDALANPWAIVLGSGQGGGLRQDSGGRSWTGDGGVRFYLDSSLTQVLGIVDTHSGVAFSFAQWVDVEGMRLPQSIVRMRGGLPDGSFLIDDYQATWAPSGQAPAPRIVTAPALPAPAPFVPSSDAAADRGLRWLVVALLALVAALGIVAWTRRDAFVERIARRLASDPRAWRQAGVSVFVSPEGVLTFEGRPYRVGPVFFNRPVLVQTSPLFIRVSARGVSRALILARKFPTPLAAGRRPVAGFSLIESLTACALFATVIIAAIFPALVVLARADALAAQRQSALQIASNALTDEQAALAYGAAIADGSAVSKVDGMTLTETITPSGIAGLHTLAVEVIDPRGRSLTRIVTMLGPPVPPPGSPSSSPSPGASE